MSTDAGVPKTDPMYLDLPKGLRPSQDGAIEEHHKSETRNDLIISGNILSANFPAPLPASEVEKQQLDKQSREAILESRRAAVRMSVLMEVRTGLQ